MSETQEHGVLHHKIGFNDRVYLVGQIDDLLALKQDKLVPGPGISILEDGTIQLAELPRQEIKCVAECKDLTNSIDGTLEFDEAHRFYSIITNTNIDPVLRLGGVLSTSKYNDIVELYLLVTLMNPQISVSFRADRNITYVGDTHFSVDLSGQTLYFILRAFRDGICVSKLGVF